MIDTVSPVQRPAGCLACTRCAFDQATQVMLVQHSMFDAHGSAALWQSRHAAGAWHAVLTPQSVLRPCGRAKLNKGRGKMACCWRLYICTWAIAASPNMPVLQMPETDEAGGHHMWGVCMKLILSHLAIQTWGQQLSGETLPCQGAGPCTGNRACTVHISIRQKQHRSPQDAAKEAPLHARVTQHAIRVIQASYKPHPVCICEALPHTPNIRHPVSTQSAAAAETCCKLMTWEAANAQLLQHTRRACQRRWHPCRTHRVTKA